MKAFGVQFRINNQQRFSELASICSEIKRDKDVQEFREPKEWIALVPDEVKSRFAWPTAAERERWLSIRPSTPIAISSPSRQIGAQWDFYRVFESIEESEYSVLGCEAISEFVGELRIDPDSYPYGGVGPIIALVEAFGFEVLGVNECGKFESREELLRGRGAG